MIAVVLAFALVWPTGTASSEAEAALLAHLQAAHPGPDLIAFPRLERFAGDRAVEISRAFRHVRFWTRLVDYRIRDWLHACEILVWNNYPAALSPGAAFLAFMGSPSHRSCIVERDYDAVGVGSYQLADGRKFYAVLYTDQAERTVISGKWLRAKPWGTKLKWLVAGTHLVVFNHRLDDRGRRWNFVRASGRYGWVAAAGTSAS